MNDGIKPIRRVVTGNDAQGRSCVLYDSAAPNVNANAFKKGTGMTDLWVYHACPAPITGVRDDGNLPFHFEPPRAGGHLRVVQSDPKPNVTSPPWVRPMRRRILQERRTPICKGPARWISALCSTARLRWCWIPPRLGSRPAIRSCNAGRTTPGATAPENLVRSRSLHTTQVPKNRDLIWIRT